MKKVKKREKTNNKVQKKFSKKKNRETRVQNVSNSRLESKPSLRDARKALGLRVQHIAERCGVLHASTIRSIEENELSGKATINSIRKLASAMECEFVYKIVPKTESSFDQILKNRSRKVAQEIVMIVNHSMALEAQKNFDELNESKKQIDTLADDLRRKKSPLLWKKL